MFHVKQNKMEGKTMETYDDDDKMDCAGCDNEIDLSDESTYLTETTYPQRFIPASRTWERLPMTTEYYCRDCRQACNDCNETIPEGEVYSDERSGDSLCGDCYCERYYMCDQCGDGTPHDEIRYDENSGYTYCPECYVDYALPSQEGYPTVKCRVCDTYNVHFHLLSEKYVCDCEADKAPTAYIMRVNTLQNA